MMKKTMLAVALAAAGLGFASPALAVYNPVIGYTSDGSAVSMPSQGFSQTTVSVQSDSHVQDASDATNANTWGGVSAYALTEAGEPGEGAIDIQSYSVTDTTVEGSMFNQIFSTVFSTTDTELAFGGEEATSYDQSGGDIGVTIQNNALGAFTLDGAADNSISGQVISDNKSTVMLLSSNNVTGTVYAGDYAYSTNGNTGAWTGAW